MPRVIHLALLALLAAVLFVLSACDTFTGDSQIAQLETRNAQLQGTIEVMGTPAATIVALQAAATQNVQLQAQLSQSETDALAARATLTVLQLSGGAGIQPTQVPLSAPPGDQSIGLPTATPVAAGPQTQTTFTGTVTSSARDAQDCPLNASATFDMTTDTIYVITRVNMLPAGTTIGARWTANGALFYDDVACWTPDQDWYNICAYCSIVPDGGAFETGNWSVDLTLDGQQLSSVQFVVVDQSAAGQTQDTALTPSASDSAVTQ